MRVKKEMLTDGDFDSLVGRAESVIEIHLNSGWKLLATVYKQTFLIPGNDTTLVLFFQQEGE